MSRIKFLRNRFNVINNGEMKHKYDLLLEDENFEVHKIIWNRHNPSIEDGIFFISYKDKSNRRPKYKYYLEEGLFNNVVDADPSNNQMYAQWILDVLVQMPTKHEGGSDMFHQAGVSDFTTFIFEDLPKTTANLTLFEENKRKKRFKDACASNFGVKDIEDPTNINQYTSFDQLYAAVFPFKENLNPSDLEKKLDQFVQLGQAIMPVKDEHFTVFIPKTLAASEIFSFTNWCTATKGNGMFKSYTTNDKRGDGSNSELVIIIDSGVFTGQNENLYQLHIESDQFRDKTDKTFTGYRDKCLNKSLSLRNFTRDYLSVGYKMARTSSDSKSEGNYYKRIMEFGMCEVLFDILDNDIPSIRFRNVGINRIPPLGRFNRLKSIHLDKVGLKQLNDDIFTVKNLELLSIPFNNITTLPNNIGEAKNLILLNIAGNPIKEVPESIKYLDPTRGGKLKRISLNEKNVELATKLKEYLPSITIMGVKTLTD